MESGINLNDNDNKLLTYCLNTSHTISEIARKLEIAPKNISVRVEKLKKANLIKIEKHGTKKFIRTLKGDKTKKYFLDILKQIKERNGEVSAEEFKSLLPISSTSYENFDEDKFSAPWKLLYTYPPLVESFIKITKQGEQFLKENEK